MWTYVLYTLAVIADFQSDALSLDIECHLNGVRIRVFERVCESFLRDPIEMIGRRRT